MKRPEEMTAQEWYDNNPYDVRVRTSCTLRATEYTEAIEQCDDKYWQHVAETYSYNPMQLLQKFRKLLLVSDNIDNNERWNLIYEIDRWTSDNIKVDAVEKDNPYDAESRRYREEMTAQIEERKNFEKNIKNFEKK